MYMHSNNAKKTLLKYIKKIILETAGTSFETSEGTSLVAELNKPINKPFPIGNEELDRIKKAIFERYPDKKTVDFKNNTITFSINGMPSNFYFVIRKVEDVPNVNQFKYVIWYVPFKEKEEIGMPGKTLKKESDPFDKTVKMQNLLDLLGEFVTDGLLTN